MRGLLAAAGLGLLWAGLWTAPAAALDIAPVRSCIEKNAPEKTSIQTIEMLAVDRIGAERSLEGKIYWKRFDDGFSRVLAHFSKPADIDGARLLMIGKAERNDMFLYMPAIKKVRRINSQTLKGNIFGTDFSYEDFERLQGMQGEVEPERLPDAVVDEVEVFVLQASAPAETESAYQKAISYIDRKTCVPIKVELYESGDRLRKVLSIDPTKVTREKEVWVPRELVMRDLRDETYTKLLVKDIEVDGDIPDRTFSTSALERKRSR